MKEIYRVYKIERDKLEYQWFEMTYTLDGFQKWGDYETEEEAIKSIDKYGNGEFFIKKVYII